MKRNRVAAGLAALALVWLCSPDSAAQTVRDNARQQPVQMTKTVKQVGGTAWEVTLTVEGGGTQPVEQSADIVLVLDCSSSMTAQTKTPIAQTDAAQSVAQRDTRIGVCKQGVQEFLQVLAASQRPVRVGVVAYAGEASILAPLTALPTQSADAQEESACDVLQNAVSNLWQVAYSDTDLCYGSGRGSNLERALAAAGTLLKSGSGATQTVVVVGSAQPGAYGEREKSCLVPETDRAYATPQQVENATSAALQTVQKSGAARVFTVGVGTSGLSAYASSGAAYTVSNEDVAAPLREIAALLGQSVQAPLVTDSAGEGLVIDAATPVCAPQRLGVGTQPYVTVAPDGKKLYWNLGAWLAQGRPATLRYTVRTQDANYSTADQDLPLGIAALTYLSPGSAGRLQTKRVECAAPAVRYTTGALRVYSSGLPAQLGGTAQTVGPTPVTPTARFAVDEPAQYSGWRIDSVVRNGAVQTPEQFAAETEYRLPVQPGLTVVEYRYVPAPQSQEEWHYTVQYYRDGLLLAEHSETASVPASAPVVEGVSGCLEALPGCAENPARTWPYTLTQDGEVLRVDYLTQPRPDAQLYVRHTYTDANGGHVGSHTTAPADAQQYNVRDLFSLGYGGKVYMPVLATVVTTSADGTQEQQKNVPLGGSFAYESGQNNRLEIRYVPLGPEHGVD